jgi:hypothetical protein
VNGRAIENIMEVKILLTVGLTTRQESRSVPAHEDNRRVNLAVLSSLQSEKFNAVNSIPHS